HQPQSIAPLQQSLLAAAAGRRLGDAAQGGRLRPRKPSLAAVSRLFRVVLRPDLQRQILSYGRLAPSGACSGSPLAPGAAAAGLSAASQSLTLSTKACSDVELAERLP